MQQNSINLADRSRYELAVSLWKEWNEKINVISRKDSDFIFEHHILHSLCIAEYVSRYYGVAFSSICQPSEGAPVQEGELEKKAKEMLIDGDKGLRILDLGTGGGFPGIPLAMQWPMHHFTLCDSIGKKIKVAGAVASGLGLKNVTFIQARVEELKDEYDFVVSRAVAPLEQLYAWVGKKFRRSLICLKGGDIFSEIDTLCRRFGISKQQVRTLAISEFISDPYYEGKYIIEVKKGNF